MISENLKKRFYTSLVLLFLLFLSYKYTIVLILSLILVFIFSIMEFYNLLIKIFYKINLNSILIKYFFIIFGFLFLLLFVVTIFMGISNQITKVVILHLFFICILSDLGGIAFGKTFKGKKLTKISPNKTISGSIGSFFFASSLVPVIYDYNFYKPLTLIEVFVYVITVAFFNQIGDLFISFMKRKAQVKDTGKLLPGHGGILDRIDGMLLAIPIGMFFLMVSRT
jgi:phosphatidate cytidylyltransferase